MCRIWKHATFVFSPTITLPGFPSLSLWMPLFPTIVPFYALIPCLHFSILDTTYERKHVASVLLSLAFFNPAFSNSTHFSVDGKMTFLFTTEKKNFVVSKCHIFFIHSSVGGPLGHFPALAICEHSNKHESRSISMMCVA